MLVQILFFISSTSKLIFKKTLFRFAKYFSGKLQFSKKSVQNVRTISVSDFVILNGTTKW
jgi:hypothetical protein